MTTTASQPAGLPWLAANQYVSDGGLETDLIFNRGVDLPEFAAFPLVESDQGRSLLRDYYDGYAAIARDAGAGLTLESPTWRANPDWASKVGYDASALDRANRAAISFLDRLRESYADLDDVRIIGSVGPRGDGYVAGETIDPVEAERYHRPQIQSLASAGADVIAVYTLTGAEEGIGVVRAAREVGIPVLVGFTVETDGRLPDGTALEDAIDRVTQAAPADGYVVNCAHPTHIAPGLNSGADGSHDSGWRSSIVQVNPNASTASHAELDAADELDTGDLALLATSYDAIRPQLPGLRIVGGCCGTDARHVAALWGR